MLHTAPVFAVRRALASLLTAVMLAGCAAEPAVRTEAAPGQSVATRATFAWAESAISWPDRKPAAVDAELQALVRDAVVAQLVERGYAENAGTPEFVVSFHVTVRDLPEHEFCTLRTRVLPDDPGREVEVCRVPGTRTSRVYREGTLIVFVVDRASGVLLWQGVAEDTARSVAEARDVIRGAVERMFSDFPARAR